MQSNDWTTYGTYKNPLFANRMTDTQAYKKAQECDRARQLTTNIVHKSKNC